MNSLVVFDLNGVLNFYSRHKWRLNVICREFIGRMEKKYRLAIWSSSQPEKGQLIVDRLFADFEPPLFSWFSPSTDPDPDIALDEKVSPWATIKNLDQVEKVYDFEKIVIVDDNPRKTRFNSPAQVITVKQMENFEIATILDFYSRLEADIDEKINSM